MKMCDGIFSSVVCRTGVRYIRFIVFQQEDMVSAFLSIFPLASATYLQSVTISTSVLPKSVVPLYFLHTLSNRMCRGPNGVLRGLWGFEMPSGKIFIGAGFDWYCATAGAENTAPPMQSGLCLHICNLNVFVFQQLIVTLMFAYPYNLTGS